MSDIQIDLRNLARDPKRFADPLMRLRCRQTNTTSGGLCEVLAQTLQIRIPIRGQVECFQMQTFSASN